jgi:hypothetical protein
MRQLVRFVVGGSIALLIAAAVIGFVATLIYSLLPNVLLALLFSIPAFLWSLRDLWWTVSLVLAALVIWAYLDEINEPNLYLGGVLRGRDTQTGQPMNRATSPPRRTQRFVGSAGASSKQTSSVTPPRGAATSTYSSGAGVPGSAGRMTQGRSTGAAGRGATNTPASGGKSGSGVVGPRVSNVRHRRHS